MIIDNINVLFLNMSTLPSRGVSQCYFKVDSSLADEMHMKPEEVTPYLGQLEPVPVLLMKALQKRGETLDRLIVLNTQETMEYKVSISREFGEYGTCSAYEFFVQRMMEESRKHQSENPLTRQDFVSCVFKPGQEQNTEREYAKAIYEAVEELRQIKRACGDKGKMTLWMDIHGGPRNLAYIDYAIINLLREEGIYPKTCFTITWEDKLYQVRKDDISAEVLDYTIAMNEFMSYGRGDGLERYVEQYHGDDMPTRRLMKVVRMLSDAIRICDVVEFDKGLDMLQAELNSRHQYAGLMNSFKDSIRQDFGRIFQNDEQRLVEEIRWCEKKGFLQQALALIESQMPEYFCKHFFTERSCSSYDEDHWMCRKEWEAYWKDKVKVLQDCRGGKDRKWESIFTQLFAIWADENYFISYYDDENDGKPGQIWETRRWASEAEGVERLSDLKYVEWLCSRRSSHLKIPLADGEKPEFVSKLLDNGWIEAVCKVKKKIIRIRMVPAFDVSGEKSEDYAGILQRVLYLHHLLLKHRNMIMHAVKNGQRANAEELAADIRQYVKWLDELNGGIIWSL